MGKKLPKQFTHPACKECIKQQIKKYGKITIRCNGYRHADYIITDEVKRHMSENEIKELRALYDPVEWAYNNIEVKPGQPWVPRVSRDGIEYQANLLRCSAYREIYRLGRRAGKSESLAILIMWYSLTNNSCEILVIAPFQSQLDEIFERVTSYIESSPKIKIMFEKFTKTPHIKLSWKNGSVVKALPIGKTGTTVRSKSADIIIVDEADYVDERTWSAFLPILNDTPNTRMMLASTPSGRKSRFYLFAHSPTYKEWHYPSTILPHWNDQMEAEMRAELTNVGYQHEVLAEWGDSELLAVQNKYIEQSKADYIYEIKLNPGWVYSMGVDWNSHRNGTRIIITGHDVAHQRWKIVYKEIIDSKEWTQTKSIEKILELIELYQISYVFLDDGYGATNLEVIRKYADMANPDSRIYKIKDYIKAINFSSMLEVKDPITNKKVLKPAKPFMVENMVRFFEKNIINISKYDEDLVRQLENYGVIGFRKDNGIPIYGTFDNDIGDHDVDALMLSLLPFTLYSTLFEQTHLSGGLIAESSAITPIVSSQKQEEDDDDDDEIEIIDYQKEPHKLSDVETQSFKGMSVAQYFMLKERQKNSAINQSRFSRKNIRNNPLPRKRTWR